MPAIAGLTSPVPRVDAPTLQILIAAFMSLLCNVLHFGHCHSLVFKSSSSKTYPHLEQVLDEG